MAELLRRLRAAAQSSKNDDNIFTWLNDKGKEETTMSARELWERSGFVADKILKNKNVRPGDRVMLVYPFGLEFLVGLIACMRAGVIAVSVYPPNPTNLSGEIPKFTKFYEDCGATVALTTTNYRFASKMYSLSTVVFLGSVTWPQGLEWITTNDRIKSGYVRETPNDAPIQDENVMFIQYTSGSTGNPKGVMVTSKALDANLLSTYVAMKADENTVAVVWVPQYHDYGLIGGYLQTCFNGAHCVAMSPLTFIQRPLLWAETIDKYKATHTGGPNFAYSLLAKRISQSGVTYDMSSLVHADISAEPIAPSTLQKMVDIGIPSRAIMQTYGIAECVGMLLTCGKGVDPKTCLPSCGVVSQATKMNKHVVIVDDDGKRVSDGTTGHIFAAAPDVVPGYWGKEELSKVTMRVKLGVSGLSADLHWLRTGDLGYIKNDQLYVTGRQKEVIIIQGRNFYPHDIERLVESEFDGSIRPGCICAGQYTTSSVFVVAEVYPTSPLLDDSDIVRLKNTVKANCNVAVGRVVLLSKGTLPKTTSGKIRRVAIRKAVCQDGLDSGAIVATWEFADCSSPTVPMDEPRDVVAPSPDKNLPNIAIIGAGPGGLVAALTLLDQGYTNITIFERENFVGGRSVGFDDYCKIYIGNRNYKAIRNLADRFGIHNPVIGSTSQKKEDLSTVLNFPEHAAMPCQTLEGDMCLASRQSPEIEKISALAGYGLCDSRSNYQDYFAQFVRVGVSPEYDLFPGQFFRSLWEAVASHLTNAGIKLRLGYTVSNIQGRCIDGEAFDKLILAILPKDALSIGVGRGNNFIEQSLSKVHQNRYGAVTFEAEGLDHAGLYEWNEAHREASTVGSPLKVYWDDENEVWYALVYTKLGERSSSPPEVDEETVARQLKTAIAGRGGAITKILGMKIWDFFPHLPEDSVRDGFFEKWERDVQGKHGIYWTGAFFGFELTETVARHASGLIRNHFPVCDGGRDSHACLEEGYAVLDKITTEIYPQFMKGPTFTFPKYYMFEHTTTLYSSGQWIMDANAILDIEPESGVPEDLLVRIFGKSASKATWRAEARFMDTISKPSYMPRISPILYLNLPGTAASIHFVALMFYFPTNPKTLLDALKGALNGTSVRVGRPAWWRHEETTRLNSANNVFDCPMDNWGAGTVYQMSRPYPSCQELQ